MKVLQNKILASNDLLYLRRSRKDNSVRIASALLTFVPKYGPINVSPYLWQRDIVNLSAALLFRNMSGVLEDFGGNIADFPLTHPQSDVFLVILAFREGLIKYPGINVNIPELVFQLAEKDFDVEDCLPKFQLEYEKYIEDGSRVLPEEQRSLLKGDPLRENRLLSTLDDVFSEIGVSLGWVWRYPPPSENLLKRLAFKLRSHITGNTISFPTYATLREIRKKSFDLGYTLSHNFDYLPFPEVSFKRWMNGFLSIRLDDMKNIPFKRWMDTNSSIKLADTRKPFARTLTAIKMKPELATIGEIIRGVKRPKTLHFSEKMLTAWEMIQRVDRDRNSKEDLLIYIISIALASVMASAVGFTWSTVTFLYKKIRSKLRRRVA